MPPDRPVLAFDTSAAHCAAAVFSDGRLILSRDEPMASGQSERLMPFLLDCLGAVGIAWGDLGRIAVGTGPGNFTGVRIAVAAARGLALGLGRPALGVDRFEATAFGLDRPLLVALDARQGRVALRAFGAEPAGRLLIEPGEPLPGALGALPVAGDGVALLGGRARGPELSPLPIAEAIARIAAARPLPQPRPAPLYLRPADALPARDRPPPLLP